MLTNGKKLDGRYVIREQIGGGGFGAVFLAEDTRFSGKNLVAIKQILQNNPQIAQSFRREADLLYNLSHPNLPKVTNCFQEDGANFIVMDYISGEDLAQKLIKGNRFSVAEVLNIADKVLDALEYLHATLIFHRDIKPHNIKIDESGRIFLLDFGTAKGSFDETTVTQNIGQSITGFTPFYAPLEQVLRVDPNSFLLLQSTGSPHLEDFLDRKTDERSDIYSLGATLYHLLTRISPEKATSTFRAFSVWSGKLDPLINVRDINADVSAELANVIHRSLSLEPKNRFQTAAEFRTALKNPDGVNQTAEIISQSTQKTQVLNTASEIIKYSPEKTKALNTSEPISETRLSVEPTRFVVENASVAPISNESAAPVSFASPVFETAPKNVSKSKAVLLVGAAILLLALVGLGSWLAMRKPSENGAANTVALENKLSKNTSTTQENSLPENVSAEEKPLPKDVRKLSYSLLVQKMRDGKKFQEPFEASGQEIFESGYEFQMRFNVPSEKGFIYIFAEGLDEKKEEVFNIVFPTPKRNEGSASVAPGQNYETGWNKFGGTPGTENFWIIWSKEQPEILEKSRENSFANNGTLSNKPLITELRNYLDKYKNDTNSSKDFDQKLTKIEFSGNSMAYLIKLEHR